MKEFKMLVQGTRLSSW